MKKTLIFLMLLCICLESFSQSKPQRRIYLWDVTLSMKGFGGAPNIYDSVVDFIKREINSITDENTEIVVLPFQTRVLEQWVVYATESGKKEIINKITSYYNNNVTSTDIVTPMKETQQKYITKDKRNLLFLLTDGKQSGGNNELLSIIRNWGEYAKINNDHAVYVMLTDSAIVDEIKEVIEITPGIETITGDDWKRLDWIDLYPEEIVKFNIKDDKEKPVNIPLIYKKNIDLPENIKVEVSCDNPLLTFRETAVIKNNAISFNLKFDYQTLKDSLPEKEQIDLHIELINSDQVQKTTGKIILLIPNDIKLELINKPEKTLKIHVKKN